MPRQARTTFDTTSRPNFLLPRDTTLPCSDCERRGAASLMYSVTFYSFKGGVGRTMALLNCAIKLAKRGRRILVVDFDLEAPSLHTYEPFVGKERELGLVDYIAEYLHTRVAPDVRGYVSECRVDDYSVW